MTFFSFIVYLVIVMIALHLAAFIWYECNPTRKRKP